MPSNSIPAEEILEALRQVIDPEIGINIVDLGLVYSVAVVNSSARVKMTLTTPGCPMHESISWGVKNAVAPIEGIIDTEVELVFEPAWHPGLMSERARAALGYGDPL
ncbi:MAG TPA: metal-sulfur cluster assembly factor [Verrucomicrobiae bacterium]|nr:metal-sulfur cluster assembly factor [Verrucomicrobiae bacterium]